MPKKYRVDLKEKAYDDIHARLTHFVATKTNIAVMTEFNELLVRELAELDSKLQIAAKTTKRSAKGN